MQKVRGSSPISSINREPSESRTSMMVARMSNTPFMLGTRKDHEVEHPQTSDGAKVGLSLREGWGPHCNNVEIDHAASPAR